MITTEESASALVAQLKSMGLLYPSHISQAEALTTIRTHIYLDRHAVHQSIAAQSTPLIDTRNGLSLSREATPEIATPENLTVTPLG